MKKSHLFICILIMLCAFLFGCDQQVIEADPTTLSFPGTQWGTSPEEVCSSLELTDGSYTEEYSDPYLYIQDTYLDIFGETACVGFQFSDDNGDGRFSLCRIVAIYPQNADMQAVQAAMESAYGAPTDQMESKYADWSSAVKCQDYMTAQDKEFLSAQGSAGTEPMEAPLSTIELTTYYPFSASYQEEPTTNVVTFQSSYGFYVNEGGYTGK